MQNMNYDFLQLMSKLDSLYEDDKPVKNKTNHRRVLKEDVSNQSFSSSMRGITKDVKNNVSPIKGDIVYVYKNLIFETLCADPSAIKDIERMLNSYVVDNYVTFDYTVKLSNTDTGARTDDMDSPLSEAELIFKVTPNKFAAEAKHDYQYFPVETIMNATEFLGIRYSGYDADEDIRPIDYVMIADYLECDEDSLKHLLDGVCADIIKDLANSISNEVLPQISSRDYDEDYTQNTSTNLEEAAKVINSLLDIDLDTHKKLTSEEKAWLASHPNATNNRYTKETINKVPDEKIKKDLAKIVDENKDELKDSELDRQRHEKAYSEFGRYMREVEAFCKNYTCDNQKVHMLSRKLGGVKLEYRGKLHADIYFSIPTFITKDEELKKSLHEKIFSDIKEALSKVNKHLSTMVLVSQERRKNIDNYECIEYEIKQAPDKKYVIKVEGNYDFFEEYADNIDSKFLKNVKEDLNEATNTSNSEVIDGVSVTQNSYYNNIYAYNNLELILDWHDSWNEYYYVGIETLINKANNKSIYTSDNDESIYELWFKSDSTKIEVNLKKYYDEYVRGGQYYAYTDVDANDAVEYVGLEDAVHNTVSLKDSEVDKLQTIADMHFDTLLACNKADLDKLFSVAIEDMRNNIVEYIEDTKLQDSPTGEDIDSYEDAVFWQD